MDKCTRREQNRATHLRRIAARKAAGLCPRCGLRPPAAGYVNCDICRQYGRTTYRRLVATGLCPVCCNRPPEPGKVVCGRCRYQQQRATRLAAADHRCPKCGKPHAGKTKYCASCLHNARQRSRRLRDAVFAAYGGARCNCPGCTVTEPEFLQIDHIHNDGAAHRRQLGGSGNHLYLWLKRHGFPAGFQVLCANCNYAKGKYGQCPHISRDGTHEYSTTAAATESTSSRVY